MNLSLLYHKLPSPLNKIALQAWHLSPEAFKQLFLSAEDKETIMKAYKAVEDILACSDADFGDLDFFLQKIKEFGLINQKDWDWGKYSSWLNRGIHGLLQYPPEFAEFCLTISRLNIATAIEIGSYAGFSSYFMAAVLQRANPDLEFYIVDIVERLVGFKKFSAILNLKKHIPATSENFKGQPFDFVFIDGDHSYDGAMLDYVNIGKFCKKAFAFHDIHATCYDAQGGGIRKAWKEVLLAEQSKCTFKEFSYCTWMGIGLGMRQAKPNPHPTRSICRQTS